MSEKNTSPVVDEQAEHHGRVRDLASRLYRGEAGIDVIGKRKYFYGVAVAIVLIAAITFAVRPFNLGIDFKGGETFTLPASVGTLDQARTAIADQGAQISSAQTVGGAGTPGQYLIKTALLDPDSSVASHKATAIKAAVAKQFHLAPDQISEEAVSGAWSSSVTSTAGIAALVFLVL